MLRSLLDAHLASFKFAHHGLVAKDHGIEAACIRMGYGDPQQVLNAALIPAWPDGDEFLEGVSTHAQQREPPAVQVGEKPFYLEEGSEYRWVCQCSMFPA